MRTTEMTDIINGLAPGNRLVFNEQQHCFYNLGSLSPKQPGTIYKRIPVLTKVIEFINQNQRAFTVDLLHKLDAQLDNRFILIDSYTFGLIPFIRYLFNRFVMMKYAKEEEKIEELKAAIHIAINLPPLPPQVVQQQQIQQPVAAVPPAPQRVEPQQPPVQQPPVSQPSVALPTNRQHPIVPATPLGKTPRKHSRRPKDEHSESEEVDTEEDESTILSPSPARSSIRSMTPSPVQSIGTTVVNSPMTTIPSLPPPVKRQLIGQTPRSMIDPSRQLNFNDSAIFSGPRCSVFQTPFTPFKSPKGGALNNLIPPPPPLLEAEPRFDGEPSPLKIDRTNILSLTQSELESQIKEITAYLTGLKESIQEAEDHLNSYEKIKTDMNKNAAEIKRIELKLNQHASNYTYLMECGESGKTAFLNFFISKKKVVFPFFPESTYNAIIARNATLESHQKINTRTLNQLRISVAITNIKEILKVMKNVDYPKQQELLEENQRLKSEYEEVKKVQIIGLSLDDLSNLVKTKREHIRLWDLAKKNREVRLEKLKNNTSSLQLTRVNISTSDEPSEHPLIKQFSDLSYLLNVDQSLQVTISTQTGENLDFWQGVSNDQNSDKKLDWNSIDFDTGSNEDDDLNDSMWDT